MCTVKYLRNKYCTVLYLCNNVLHSEIMYDAITTVMHCSTVFTLIWRSTRGDTIVWYSYNTAPRSPTIPAAFGPFWINMGWIKTLPYRTPLHPFLPHHNTWLGTDPCLVAATGGFAVVDDWGDEGCWIEKNTKTTIEITAVGLSIHVACGGFVLSVNL